MNKSFPACVKNTVVAHKKKLCGIIIIIALLGVFAAGVHAMLRVSGVVTGINNNSVTVTNFYRTQTVELTGLPVNVDNIKIGDKIKVYKNLQGTVYNIVYIYQIGRAHV